VSANPVRLRNSAEELSVRNLAVLHVFS
jgi:hypothetical protein